MNAPLMQTKPLFSSLEECLRWAFKYAQLYAQMTPARGTARWEKEDMREREEQEGPVRSYRFDIAAKPKGMDAGAQAAMIQAYIRRLPYDEQCHVVAKFLDGEPRKSAKEFLVLRMPAWLEADYHKLLLFELVGKFYGARVSMRKLAERYEMTRYSLRVLDRRVFITLDALSVRAEKLVYEHLTEQGVIA